MTEIVISTDPTRDNLIAEMCDGSYAWGDVRYDDKKEAYEVTFYPPHQGEWLKLDLATMQKALGRAKEALVQRGYPDVPICGE